MFIWEKILRLRNQKYSCAARSGFGALGGANLAAERSEGGWSEAERSGAKWRGRGLGQRNINFNYFSFEINLRLCLLYFEYSLYFLIFRFGIRVSHLVL